MLKTGSLSNRTVQLAFGSAIAVLLVVGAFSYRSIGASIEGIILVAGALLGLLITGAAGWIVQRDNSRRRLAEEALLESERKYRMLIKGVKDCAILMLGPNGEIRSWKCGGGHACC